MRGLLNLGATCYFNAALWALLAVPDTIPEANEVCKAVLALLSVFTGEGNPVDPTPLFIRLEAHSRHFSRLEQHDAHDALLQLIDAMGTPPAFKGETQTVLKEGSKKRYGPREEFTILTVPVEECNSVCECVQKAFCKETVELDGKSIIKWTKCLSTPDVFLLHLNRFDPTDGSRVDTQVDYPESVNMRFSSQSVTYRLYYICFHVGEVESGHYICAVNRLQPEEWYVVDDSQVYPVKDVDQIMDIPEAYMLGYRRVSELQT